MLVDRQTVTIRLGDTILRIIDQHGELITAVSRLSDGEIGRLKAYATRTANDSIRPAAGRPDLRPRRPIVVASDTAGMSARRAARTMFERFTDRARRVVVEAQDEARTLNHNYIGTEHILLGLIHEGKGTGPKALESLGISLDTARQQVQEIIGQGQHAPSGHIPFTPRAKKVLELALSESKALGHHYIGTEHILLGLIHEGDGVAAQVLVKLGADLNRVRQQVIQLLHDYQAKT
jgi:hypothetical protein